MSSIIRTIAILLLFTFQSFGANWHVRSAATGSATGADWNNAYTALPATLTRGDTYYIAAGSYAGYTFDDINSGTSYITVKRATVADHGSATGWSDTYASGTATFTGALQLQSSYLILDGQTGGGPGSWEIGHGFNSTVSGVNFYTTGPRSNIVIKNFNAENGGQTNPADQNHFIAGTGNSPSYMTFQSNYWHDVSRCNFFMRAANTITVEYSKFENVGQDTFGDPQPHMEFWSGSTDNNIKIRHNIFEHISNTAVIGLVNGNGLADNWEIYGNVFVQYSVSPIYNVYATILDVKNDTVQAAITTNTSIYANNWKIYNNSIAGTPFATLGVGFRIGGSNGGGSNNVIYNNIFYTNVANEISFWSADAKYNWFYGNRRYNTFADWTSRTSPTDLDANTTQATKTIGTFIPFVDWIGGNFLPAAPITGASNLTAGFFDLVDAYGRTRGADGVLDMGAYEYVAGGGGGESATSTNRVFILRVGL